MEEPRKMHMQNMARGGAGLGLVGLLSALTAILSAQAAGGILQIRNGYFWDPAVGEYFIPRGIAYQTWNPPVGADQNFDQLEYDLVEFKKMYANSVRCEMVWNQIERSEGAFDWSRPDYLVAKAEQLGLKLFILVGFQYAPDWFTNHVGWHAVNDIGANSVVLNYERPEVRNVYSNYIYQVTRRYKDSPAIGGWILGNEYAYFDLWNPDHRYLGFDSLSLASFQSFLSNRYAGSITALNANWRSNYLNFGAIAMPRAYPPDRNLPGYHDLILWREHSIGEYVAVGAVAAKTADPNHLRTYSMIGGLFIGFDANYTCEDGKTIVARCAAAGAPLDFWSVNNYAWATLGSELRSGDFGIAKHQAQSGLPVMLSETGQSTTDNLLTGAAERQPLALPSQMWETLLSGAIGAHLFTWNDRDLFGGVFIREKGFGIVNQDRTLKTNQAYWNMVEAFRRMEDIHIDRLLGGSTNPPSDMQFFWSESSLMGWPRANQENAMLWNALKRIGYQPGILDDDQFAAGKYTNGAALILSRAYQLEPAHLDRILTNVIPSGIHVHANTDLPGQFNAYHQPNPTWTNWMEAIFGLGVSNAVPGWDSVIIEPPYPENIYRPVNFTGVGTLGRLTNGYSDRLQSWKIWHGITARSGTTVVTHTGYQGLQPPLPALQIKNLGSAKTAINTFALGDTFPFTNRPPTRDWDLRYDWLRAIYRNHFGITPAIELTGPGATYVIPDYRICQNGSILVSLLNAHTNSASVTLTAHSLLDGRTVENLTRGGVLETNSDGAVTLNLAGDDFVLLYAYPRTGGVDASLVNSNPNKIWIQSAPMAVWPNGTTYGVSIGYDAVDAGLDLFVALERISPSRKSLGLASRPGISGKGSQLLQLPVADPDLNDPDEISSRDGGAYVFHAWLEKNGIAVSETLLPVRLLWSVRPTTLPVAVTPGATYAITMDWQELPSYEPSELPWPLSRADLWESFLAGFEHYEVVLELRANGQTVASDRFLTSTGTDRHTFSITVPLNASGTFTWYAYLRPSPNSSVDLFDGFENRGPGADPAFLQPWNGFVYSESGTATYFDGGVAAEGYGVGVQSAFLVVTNPASRGSFSGFLLEYRFPRVWSLPTDFRQWINYTFGVDFKESQSRACIIELQVVDALGGAIHFTTQYIPGPDRWDNVRASLDQFAIIPYAPFTGYFNLARVQKLIVNVQMLETNAMYVGSFDNIRFDGPETAAPAGSSHDVVDSFEDRLRGEGPLFTPWTGYIYPPSVIFLNQGVQNQASDGYQSVFYVVQNPPNPPDVTVFGLAYDFTNTWALPSNRQLWTNYLFAYDFKETDAHACQVEMQVKSGPNNWMEFVKTYVPGPNGWETVRASLDQFVTPPGVGLFDPNNVQTIVLNIRMLAADTTYVGSFDNVRFETPRTPFPPDLRYGVYSSTNDTFRVRTIARDASGQLVISWSGAGRLEFADQVTGPWNNMPEVTNTVTIAPTGPRKFYRLAQ